MADMHKSPNPKRVVAGKANRQKWRGLTPAGAERLRQAALRDQPWRHATGPKTAEGKARAAANGKGRQKGARSVREVRAELAGVRGLLGALAATRQALGQAGAG